MARFAMTDNCYGSDRFRGLGVRLSEKLRPFAAFCALRLARKQRIDVRCVALRFSGSLYGISVTRGGWCFWRIELRCEYNPKFHQ